MTLSLVIYDENTKLNSKYGTGDNWQGFFVMDEKLCYRPDKKSNICYNVNTGLTFEYNNEYVYKAYFEGGTTRLHKEGEEFEGSFKGDKRKVHSSYGMICFDRVNVNPPTSLFGSSIKHGNPIRLKICHANVERSINKDYFYSGGRIAEIEMSQTQFADLITSMNIGNGVPCTIKFTERDGYIEDCDFVSKIEQFKGEFTNHLYDIESDLDRNIKEIKELLDDRKTLRKSDKEFIINTLNRVKMEISSNSEYTLDSFNEQMEKTVTEAKGEIESFMQNKIKDITSLAVTKHIKNDELLNLENPIEME